jgi:hypothetical protein
MANEITASVSLSASKDNASMTVSASKTFDMSNEDMIQATQAIGTSAEALALGDIAAPAAYIYVRNMDPTNFVVLSLVSDGSTPFSKIRPGHFAMFPPPESGTIYAKADTATVRVAVAACEQ